MNVTNFLSASTILLTTSLLLSPPATAGGEVSSYIGGGDRVTIGTNGSYYGCNYKHQCLFIKNYSYRSRGQYVWENKGITYSMIPLNNRQGAYRLRIIDRNQRVLVDRIVRVER